jgi:hypothetical protein
MINAKNVAITLFAVTAALGLAAAPAAQAATRSSVAPAINRSSCTTSALQIFNNTGELCFENAGATDVAIYHVTSLQTGNNVVNFEICLEGSPYTCETPTLGKDSTQFWTTGVWELVYIYIE